MANMKRHPAAKEQGGANGAGNKNIDVFCQEKQGKFHPGIFCVKTGR